MRRLTDAGLGLLLSICSACAAGESSTGTTDGGIYFEVSGRGAPVVLVHGFSLDRRMWDDQVALFRSGYRVVRYDLRGHGLSAPWTEPFTAVNDMLGVFDAVGLERATVVGLSAGAEIAIDFALAHPERVTALVLVSPGLGGYQPVGSFDWMAPVMQELQAGEPEQAMRAWVETPLMKIRSDLAADSAMRAVVMENWAIWTYDPQLQEAPDPPAVTRLSEIEVRTLVLIGQDDLIDTHQVGDTLATCLPDVRLTTVPGAGHLINLEAPERFAEALTTFLGEDPPASAAMRPAC